jgi:hypothetical protein
MSSRELSVWTLIDSQQRLIVRPSFVEKLLRTIGNAATLAAVELHHRRLREAERRLRRAATEISPHLRRDLGIPPFDSVQDVSNYS